MTAKRTLEQYIATSIVALTTVGEAIERAQPGRRRRAELYRSIYLAAQMMETVADPDDASDSVALFLKGLVDVYSDIDPYGR